MLSIMTTIPTSKCLPQETFLYKRKGLVNSISSLNVNIIVMHIEFKYMLIFTINKDTLLESIINLCTEVNMKL